MTLQVLGNPIPLIMDKFIRVPFKNHQIKLFQLQALLSSKVDELLYRLGLNSLAGKLGIVSCLDGNAAPCFLIVVICDDGICYSCLHARSHFG